MNDCNQMGREFGKLYEALDELVEDAPFAGTWNNVQAMVAFFKGKLNQIIDENARPVDHDVDMQPVENVKEDDYGQWQEDPDQGMCCMKCRATDFEKFHFFESCAHIICKD